MGKIKNGTREASMDLFLYVYVYIYIVFACMYIHGSLYKNTGRGCGMFRSKGARYPCLTTLVHS